MYEIHVSKDENRVMLPIMELMEKCKNNMYVSNDKDELTNYYTTLIICASNIYTFNFEILCGEKPDESQ